MKKISYLAAALLAAGSLLATTDSRAAVISCSPCSSDQYEGFSMTAGVGVHAVYDYVNADLTVWRVMKDRETRLLTTEQIALPESSRALYLDNLEAAMGTGNGAVNVEIHPDDLGPSPLDGFESYDAYDFVRNGTLRNQLGVALSSHGLTGINVVDQLIQSVVSIITGGGIPGSNEVTRIVTIVWLDGSRTTYEFRPGEVNARFRTGESRDSNGNPIPEVSIITDPDLFNDLINNQIFEFDTEASIQQWVTEMQMLGVPFTGSRTLRLVCVQVGGGQIECRYM